MSSDKDFLICPLSQNIFFHPCIIDSGHTFELIFIKKWLKRKSTCPLTRKQVHFKPNLNISIKNIIQIKTQDGSIKEEEIFKIDFFEELKYLASDPDFKKSDLIELFKYYGLPCFELFISLFSTSEFTWNKNNGIFIEVYSNLVTLDENQKYQLYYELDYNSFIPKRPLIFINKNFYGKITAENFVMFCKIFITQNDFLYLSSVINDFTAAFHEFKNTSREESLTTFKKEIMYSLNANINCRLMSLIMSIDRSFFDFEFYLKVINDISEYTYLKDKHVTLVKKIFNDYEFYKEFNKRDISLDEDFLKVIDYSFRDIFFHIYFLKRGFNKPQVTLLKKTLIQYEIKTSLSKEEIYVIQEIYKHTENSFLKKIISQSKILSFFINEGFSYDKKYHLSCFFKEVEEVTEDFNEDCFYNSKCNCELCIELEKDQELGKKTLMTCIEKVLDKKFIEEKKIEFRSDFRKKEEEFLAKDEKHYRDKFFFGKSELDVYEDKYVNSSDLKNKKKKI